MKWLILVSWLGILTLIACGDSGECCCSDDVDDAGSIQQVDAQPPVEKDAGNDPIDTSNPSGLPTKYHPPVGVGGFGVGGSGGSP